MPRTRWLDQQGLQGGTASRKGRTRSRHKCCICKSFKPISEFIPSQVLDGIPGMRHLCLDCLGRDNWTLISGRIMSREARAQAVLDTLNANTSEGRSPGPDVNLVPGHGRKRTTTSPLLGPNVDLTGVSLPTPDSPGNAARRSPAPARPGRMDATATE